MDDDFRTRVTDISTQISTIEENTNRLEESVQKKITSASDTKDEKDVNNKIQAIEEIFWRKSRYVKEELKKMENEVKNIKDNAFGSKEDFLAEAKHSHWQGLTNKFKNACTRYRAIQLKHKNSEEQKTISQYLIEYPDFSIEQIKEKIKKDQEEGIEKKFGDVSSTTRNVYSKAEQRNKKVKEISANIGELCVLIDDLHEMVKEQGGKVDRIEVHTEQTLVSTQRAKKSLGKALRYQMTATRIKRIIIAVVTLLILALLGYLAYKLYDFANKNNKGNDNNGNNNNNKND